jgi:hypothetical protein
MKSPCWAALAALCALAIASEASAQRSAPAGEAGKPAAAMPQSVWPMTLPQGKSGEFEATPAPAWSGQEIEQARGRCAELLKGLNVVAIPLAPIREFECGAPAPVRLVSIGANPQIAFSPPPVLTCDMVAALHRWLEREVQPLAQGHLGVPIVGVATMSSFSCRRAYGRANGRLSEHGRVNAIDIAGFLTAQGQTVSVVADWGPIAREIVAGAVAAQAAADKMQVGETKAPRRAVPPAAQPAPPGIAFEFPAVVVGEPPRDLSTGFGWAPPSRLGGPRAAAPEPPDGNGPFLHAARRAACAIFATVLGPEANKAHRNHFHLDMAERRSAPICE